MTTTVKMLSWKGGFWERIWGRESIFRMSGGSEFQSLSRRKVKAVMRYESRAIRMRMCVRSPVMSGSCGRLSVRLYTSRPAGREETRPLEEQDLRVNDLSVCKGHGSKGTGLIGSGKTPLTPWQTLPRVICSLPLSRSLSLSCSLSLSPLRLALFSPFPVVLLSHLVLSCFSPSSLSGCLLRLPHFLWSRLPFSDASRLSRTSLHLFLF